MSYRILVDCTLRSDHRINTTVTVLTHDPGLHDEVLKSPTDKYVSKLHLGPFDNAEQAEARAKVVIDNARGYVEWLRGHAPPKSKTIEL